MKLVVQETQLLKVKDVCAVLGVGHSVLRRWFKLGAPYQRAPNPCGGMKLYVSSPREIFAWVRSQQVAGNLDERYLQKRIPAQEARETLVATKDHLGLSLTQVAELSEVPRQTVHRILYYDTYKMKTFSRQDVIRIALLKEWVEPRRKRGGTPTKKQTQHALEFCQGIRNRAHKYLGVEYHILHSLIEDYDLDSRVNYKYAKRARGGRKGRAIQSWTSTRKLELDLD